VVGLVGKGRGGRGALAKLLVDRGGSEDGAAQDVEVVLVAALDLRLPRREVRADEADGRGEYHEARRDRALVAELSHDSARSSLALHVAHRALLDERAPRGEEEEDPDVLPGDEHLHVRGRHQRAQRVLPQPALRRRLVLEQRAGRERHDLLQPYRHHVGRPAALAAPEHPAAEVVRGARLRADVPRTHTDRRALQLRKLRIPLRAHVER